MSIYVTKPFLPPLDEYNSYIKKIFDNGVLTNEGPFVISLEDDISKYLQTSNVECVANGTLALQLAIKVLGVDGGEIITTPFSYVATTTSILWEHCEPVFVDIEPNNFMIDVDKIEAAITPRTKAIMPVHVFGYACDVEKIQTIADKYNLKVIYDGAHAFASRYKGKSLLSYGDITACSFHATKVFHTVEGGACICANQGVADKIREIKSFGGDSVGTNAKMSEMHAAMGLVNLKHLSEIISHRRFISKIYDELLSDIVTHPKQQKELEYNYIYYPVLFATEEELLNVMRALSAENIHTRRYFYPSLDRLPYLKSKQSCPIAEDISKRILCLPLSSYVTQADVENICDIICGVLLKLNNVKKQGS